MEHEVFVPVPADRLKAALTDPARVARAVPGLQQEAGAEPVAGRLKLRAGGTTITYRGAVLLSARDDGSYGVVGDGTETRGSGTVTLDLTLRLRPQDEGTALVFTGTATADGRIAELPQEAVRSATTRLLNRFAENLGAEAATEPAGETPGPDAAGTPGPDAAETAGADAAGTPGPDTAETAGPDAGEHASVFDAEVPPPSLDPDADDVAAAAGGWDFADSAEPPAEAAHARRTMIGRSAEEVDHAPPRGRYAPVPAPQTVVRGSALRWAAPAAAVAVASAIVVGRALRRRR
ncbi:SRPBCC domain-containing protein [Streptomyces pharetrae]|jgi:carbon monoxide dehydrogenase subunit G|uniref:SRPBCC domain-containing protein n=1 Tax=Streptomyces pharetrae TaxID=291370 RepID=UPI00365E7C65